MNPSLTPRSPAAAPNQGARKPRESGRLLAAWLFAAAVAGLAVATDRLMATWADEHVFKAWIALWSVVFAGSLLFAGTARRTAHRVMDMLNGWARKRAAQHAEARQKMLLQEREAQRSPHAAQPSETSVQASETTLPR